MPEPLLLTLAFLSFLLWTILIKAHLWQVYGLATYRPLGVARLSGKLSLLLALALLLTALIGPWVLMALRGSAGALAGFLPLTLITLLILVVMGVVIQRAEPLFFDLPRVRFHQVRDATQALRPHLEIVEGWASADAEERARFLERYHNLAPHRREALFHALLLQWPEAPRADLAKRDDARLFPLDHVQQWGGAHFLHHPETLLAMLTQRGDQNHWDGPLPEDCTDRLHPEVCARVLFARVEDEQFLIAPAE